MKNEVLEILILIAKIALIGIFGILVPTVKRYLQEVLTEKQRKELLYWGNLGIKIAEEKYKEHGSGLIKKKPYVIDWLCKNGIKATDEQINYVIDSIVAFYNAKGWDASLEELR